MKKWVFFNEENKLLFPFYSANFLRVLFYIYIPFYVTYFYSIGFNGFQIGTILAFLGLSQFLFEVPTGAIADLWGRKVSVIFGNILLIIFYTSFLFIQTFWGILIIVFFIGIANTFISGADNAWVVDLLNKNGKKKSVSSYFIHSQFLVNAALIFSGLLGGWAVGRFGLWIIFPFSALAFVASTICFLFGKEKHIRKKFLFNKTISNLTKQTKISLRYTRNHPVLFYWMIMSFFGGFMIACFSLFTWTPLLKMVGASDSFFGYFWTIIALTGAATPFIARRMIKKVNEITLLSLQFILAVLISIIVQFVTSFKIIFVLSLIHYSLVPFFLVVSNVFFHKFLQSKVRATVGSLQSMIFGIGNFIAYISMGYIMNAFGVKMTMVFGGIFSFINLILLRKIAEPENI